MKKNQYFFTISISGLQKGLYDLHWPFLIFMCSLIHFKAIGTNKSENFAKSTSLGVCEQILPKTTIVPFLEKIKCAIHDTHSEPKWLTRLENAK